MSHFVVKMTRDYADEFDVYGIFVMTEAEWVEYVKAAHEYIEKNPDREYYFGTNEWLDFDSPDEFDRAFKAIPISVEEYESLKRILHGYGRIPHFGKFIDFVAELNS